ncbi:Amino_acid transporter family protein [Hexamita inflata]|uniref:Amino acid transporter family protein n=1 Tax=Hexamita inflata TaxID=28002 RepID=A0AA86RBB2_9EUKA|nr:Amino acid transporter family protein [Hexamita inflata]CAI9975284.1 Amino acid transporter family protein [Hexamita inflata]
MLMQCQSYSVLFFNSLTTLDNLMKTNFISQHLKKETQLFTRKKFTQNYFHSKITVLCLLIAVFLDDVSQIQSFSANLMGIILYGVSGVMLWYKINEKVQGDAEEMGLVEDNSVQGEREVQKTEQPKWRTYVFWTSIVLLVMLNLAAIGCQVYTWVR